VRSKPTPPLEPLRLQIRIGKKDTRRRAEGAIEVVEVRGPERRVAGRAQRELGHHLVADRQAGIEAGLIRVGYAALAAGRAVEAVVVEKVLEAATEQDIQSFEGHGAQLTEHARE